MRVGLSPTKVKSSDYRPARVTICILTYVPEQIGYFAYRFDVLKICLQSITKNTELPYDLLIFDNGSCKEVVDYLRMLRDQEIIQYLILSARNVGMHEAQKIMFNTAPGEVIAYSNDDVLFYPDWLRTQLEILDTFPEVGMVCGLPVREQFRYGNRYLQTYLTRFPDISMKNGHFIPEDWAKDFLVSIGRDVSEALEYDLKAYTDIVLEYKGIKAYSTATHFQYVTPKSLILQGLQSEWDGRLMGESDKELDERIDSMGYARLTTFQRYVRHIGNIITPDLAESVVALGLTGKLRVWKPPTSFVLGLPRRRIIGGGVKRLYKWSYTLLNYQQWNHPRTFIVRLVRLRIIQVLLRRLYNWIYFLYNYRKLK
jgi:glycosyltransferase involved in cell wall biosynthesis